MMAYRDWGYKYHIVEYHMAQTESKEIPLVYTLVLYNGKRRYTAKTEIADLINGTKEEVRTMLKGYILADLSEIPDDVLKLHVWSGVYKMILKYIDDPEVLEKLDLIAR